MFVIKLLVIILLLALMVPISQNISEKFSNIDPELFYGGNVRKFVHPSILEHSIKTTNKKLETELNTTLCKKTCLYDTIKYIEGMEWSSWMKVKANDSFFHDVTQQMYDEVKQKLNSNIIYFELKQYKKNLHNTKDLLLNFDFVFIKENIANAYHVTYISTYNTYTHVFNVLTVKILGTISEDKIHMYAGNACTMPLFVDFTCRNDSVADRLVVEDSFEEMTTHDEQVEDILYEKLMASEEVSEDYWKNVEYTRNQEIVKQMFLKDKHIRTDKSSTNIYKNYPYSNDFEVVCKNAKKGP